MASFRLAQREHDHNATRAGRNPSVLAFITSWNEYLNALIFLPSNRNYTVALGIQYWMSMTDEYNLMMTAAASAIIPVIILFLFTQKYFVESIATSGVKG